MGNNIGTTKKLQYLHNLDEHWFYEKNSDEYYDITKLGVHHKSCDGNIIEENTNYTVICCGKTYCYYCNTVMHGCTDNHCFYDKNNNLIKCHSFCFENFHKKINLD